MAKNSALEPHVLRPGDPLDEWDRFVDASPQGCIFCRSWWLDAVTSGRFQILVVRKAGRIVAGMPLAFARKFIWSGITMPPLTQTLGVVLEPQEGTKYVANLSREMAALRALVDAVPTADFFRMNMHYTFTNWLPFYWAGYAQTTRYTYVLDDLSDLDAVLGDMEPHQRNKLRKAQKAGLRVDETDALEPLLEVNRKTFARQGASPSQSEGFVRALDEACARRGARTILVTRDEEGRVHSALYLVHDERCMYKLLSGGDPDLRSSGAHTLEIWRSFELAHERGLRYDCEGSMVEGLEAFNRSLGAVQKPYFEIRKFASWTARAADGLRRLGGR